MGFGCCRMNGALLTGNEWCLSLVVCCCRGVAWPSMQCNADKRYSLELLILCSAFRAAISFTESSHAVWSIVVIVAVRKASVPLSFCFVELRWTGLRCEMMGGHSPFIRYLCAGVTLAGISGSFLRLAAFHD